MLTHSLKTVAAGLLLALLVSLTTTKAAANTTTSWLVLGDSFTSGEGLLETTTDPTLTGKEWMGRDCQRAIDPTAAAAAWPVIAKSLLETTAAAIEQTFVACTGAFTYDLGVQLAEAAEQSEIEAFDLVTFSLGGNDIGFVETLIGCLDADITWGHRFISGCDTEAELVQNRINDLAGPLSEVYDKVAAVVKPGGAVVVVGYPQLIETPDLMAQPWANSAIGTCQGIAKADIPTLRAMTQTLNNQIETSVIQAQGRHNPAGVSFYFLSLEGEPFEASQNQTERHGICSDEPWLNGLLEGFGGSGIRPQRAFHPNNLGHVAIGEQVANLISKQGLVG